MDILSNIVRQHANSSEVNLPPDAAPRLRQIRGIKAVLFDVYGTLFSSNAGDISLVSKDSHDQLLRSVLGNYGIRLREPSASLDTHKRFLDIIKRHHEIRRNDGIDFPEVDIRSVWKEFLFELESDASIPDGGYSSTIDQMAVEFECRVNPVQVMPGLQSCLQSVRASGRVMGIISNAQFYTPLLFSGLLGSNLEDLGFCDQVSVWSYQIREGKPSQRLYQLAARKLKEYCTIEPDEVLYIGNDIRNDIWPAQAIGFRTALFAGDALSLRRREEDPRCTAVIPDLELTHLDQLSSCLD